MSHRAIVLASAEATLCKLIKKAARGLPFASVTSFADLLASAPGTLCFLDTTLPGLPEWTNPVWGQLAERNQFVVLTGTPSDAEGLLALDAGASGYCHCYAALATLRNVITVTGEGGIWVGRSLLSRLLRGVDRALPAPARANAWDQGLTAREREVALMAARGDANQAIAAELKITERTVKAHLTTIFRKLDIADRLQLALKVHGVK